MARRAGVVLMCALALGACGPSRPGGASDAAVQQPIAAASAPTPSADPGATQQSSTTPVPASTATAPVVDPGPPTALPPSGYRLVWADEFDGPALDESKWSYYIPVPPDDPGSVSDRASITVQNGVLRDTVFTDAQGIHHVGQLWAATTFAFKYGYMEGRIRFHGAPGAWCAMWLQTPTMGSLDTLTYGAEIDLVEHRAFNEYGQYLGDQGDVGLNWGVSGTQRQTAMDVRAPPNGVPLEGNWHTFGLLWTDSKYTWYFDHYPVWETSTALSGHAEFPLLTCQVLDGTWAGNVPAGGYGSLASSTIGMEVDYVRVWQP